MKQIVLWVTNKKKGDLVREKDGKTWEEYIDDLRALRDNSLRTTN